MRSNFTERSKSSKATPKQFWYLCARHLVKNSNVDYKAVATRIITSSSAWQGIFSAMTDKQVAALSNEIVQDIRRR